MSAAAIEPGFVVPHFSPEVIDGALAMAEAYPVDFRHQQLGLMALHNNPLQLFFREKVAAFASRGESGLSDTWIANYVIGHAALRSAVSVDMPLPARGHEYIHRVAYFAHCEPEVFVGDVEEDYAAYPDMQGLLKRLGERHDGNIDGARLMFGIYGSWANLAREPRVLPPAPGLAQPSAIRSGAQKRQERAYSTNTRFHRK